MKKIILITFAFTLLFSFVSVPSRACDKVLKYTKSAGKNRASKK